MKADKTVDRRVARTQRSLRDALIALILERGWSEVNVQDVCARADVGRSTFYVHFADKEELLLSGFDQLQSELRELARSVEPQRLSFVRPLIEHVRGNQRLWRALVGKQCGQAVQKRLLRLIAELLESDFAALALPGAPRTAAVRYTAGAFLEVLVWWLDSRTGLDGAQLEKLLHELTEPVLKQVKRWSTVGSELDSAPR